MRTIVFFQKKPHTVVPVAPVALMEERRPSLYFEEPSLDEVRVQWFAIMLGDQILCSHAAAMKFSHGKKRAKQKQTSQDCRPISTSCLDSVVSDPLLHFTLWPDWLDANGARCMKEVVAYAMRTSPKMEQYMKDAYDTLLQTEDHLYMMAAIFFYISWLCSYDAQTKTVTARRDPPPNSFLQTYLKLDNTTLAEICSACYAFERGRDQMTSFPSFVHTLVTNHFKRVR